MIFINYIFNTDIRLINLNTIIKYILIILIIFSFLKNALKFKYLINANREKEKKHIH